jgi:SAM-dependent methyltransferase
MRDDGRRWDERYRATTLVEPHQPEALLRWPHLATQLPVAGRVLDIASGPGSVALWAAERGFDVTALDASAVAISLLERTADDLGHSGRLDGRIDARVVDLDDGLPADIVDVDLIVCQRFREPALTTVIIDRLSVGGYALVTVLSAVGAEQPGDFHAAPGALADEFGVDDRCDILHHHEGGGVSHIVVRRR